METKKCPKCNVIKPLSEYYSCKAKKVSSYCNPCFAEYKKEHYQKNKEKSNKERYRKKKNRKQIIRNFINSCKEGKQCIDCGEIHPVWAMDYDHRDPSMKKFIISDACKYAYSMEKLKEEIDKCDLVCALCHRYRTHGQKRETK